MSELEELVKLIKTIATAIPLFFKTIREFEEEIHKFCDTNLSLLTDLKHKKTEQSFKAKDIVLELIIANNGANLYTEQVMKVLFCCNCKKLTEILRDVRAGRWQLLQDFLYQMKRELGVSESMYQEFVPNYEEVQSKLIAATLLSDELKLEAESKKIKVQNVGNTLTTVFAAAATGGVTSAIAGVGVATSIASGFCTLGLTVPIGLTVTGGIVAVIGGAAAIANSNVTIHITNEYVQIIQLYKQMYECLCEISKTSDQLREQVEIIKTSSYSIRTAVDRINYYERRRMQEPLCEALTYLSQRHTKYYPLITTSSSGINKCSDELNTAIRQLY